MPSPEDLGFELLPADSDALTADQMLEVALGTTPDDTLTPPQVSFGRGWAFDFTTGQFVRRGGAPAEVSGPDELRVWIEKTLRTGRFSHVIYSDEYGIDKDFEVIGTQLTGPLAAALEDATSEALLVHDRITEVRDFFFTADPDSDVLLVSFRVVTDQSDPITFQLIPILEF